MDSRAKEVVRMGDKLFSDKYQLNSLHQELALNFYPERADFTNKRNIGDEYADHLFSSFPVMARREFGNMLDEFLFPDKFFSIHVDDEELDEGDAERAFLERLTNIMYRAMTDPAANLIIARGQTNHDFATFGDGVIKFGLNVARDALLYTNYHLRDCAWTDNAEGRTDLLHRDWNPSARQLSSHFKDKVSGDVKRALEKDPDKRFPCRHVVLPSRIYRYQSKGGKDFDFVSLYVECESETVLEEVGLNYFCYVVPHWQRVSGSQYSSSMATSILLPDGRTMQVVMRTIREAGEKYVDPPMIAVGEAIRGDLGLYAGGVTNVDAEYDERLGEVLRPITRDRGGFPIGKEVAGALRDDITKGWFLDKIKLPETSYQMTATQVRRIIQEHIRAAGPISKPIQASYNYPLCDGTFQLLSLEKVFPFEQMPQSLQGRDLKFKFRSPLDELVEQNEADTYVDVRDRIYLPAIQLDPSLKEIVDLEASTRDAMRSAGWQAKWFKPKEAVAGARQQQAQQQQLSELAGQVSTAGQVAQEAGKGVDALMTAGQPKGGAGGSPQALMQQMQQQQAMQRLLGQQGA
jgi:hypothetical protein